MSDSIPDGIKVLEGALRNPLDFSWRIGEVDLPREGMVLLAVGGSDGAPERTNLFGFDCKTFCDDLLLGIMVVVLSSDLRRSLESGRSISCQL